MDAKTIVSPDAIESEKNVTTAPITSAGERVILVPMAEWKQCAQRGVRSAMQALVFMIPVGVTGYLRGLGLPDASLINLPTTGQPLVDAVLYSLVFGLVVFVWNAIEFMLDIDIRAPKFRA